MMSDLIRISLDDIVYMLNLAPFNYIVAMFMISFCFSVIYRLCKGGDK